MKTKDDLLSCMKSFVQGCSDRSKQYAARAADYAERKTQLAELHALWTAWAKAA